MVWVQSPERSWMEANQIEIKTLLLSIAAVAAVELATTLLVSQHPHEPMLILAAARFLEIILIIIVVSIRQEGLSSLGLKRSRLFLGLKRGLIWSTGFGVVAALCLAILFFIGVNGIALVQVRLPATHSDILIFFLVGGLIGPVAEEVFFRGVLYSFLRRWGVALAVVLSTLIFVLPHLAGRGIPFTQTVGGIVFAVAYEVEGSLMVPITIHVLGNVAIFILSLMA